MKNKAGVVKGFHCSIVVGSLCKRGFRLQADCHWVAIMCFLPEFGFVPLLILGMPLARGCVCICVWLMMNIIVLLWLTECCVCFERRVIRKCPLCLQCLLITQRVRSKSIAFVCVTQQSTLRNSFGFVTDQRPCFIELKVKWIDLRVKCGEMALSRSIKTCHFEHELVTRRNSTGSFYGKWNNPEVAEMETNIILVHAIVSANHTQFAV